MQDNIVSREDMPIYTDDSGYVGVLYSPGWGAGFWHLPQEYQYLRKHAELVKACLDGCLHEKVRELGFEEFFCFGLEQASVAFVDKSCRIRVTEYDGFESVEIVENYSTF